MSAYVLARIHAIQRELDDLGKVVAHQVDASRRRTQLKGLWKGTTVDEEDLDEAERALFRHAYESEL